MFARDPEDETAFQPSAYIGLAMAVSVVGLLVIGFYPTPLIQASESAARVFAA